MEELWGSMGLGWESSLVFDPNWLYVYAYFHLERERGVDRIQQRVKCVSTKPLKFKKYIQKNIYRGKVFRALKQIKYSMKVF